MELLQNYKGAVFFVDILGISALTNNNITLTNEDFKPWLKSKREKYSNQYLGASILVEFRKLLLKLGKENTKLKITQLSDCAFIWSEEISDVIIFCSKFMHQAIENGILCRGGIAYGEIIETNHSHELGRFILGDAVTQAAKLEGQSKGCRILINRELPENFWEQNLETANKIYSLFQPFTNPVDFTIYDEFKWYLTPELDYQNLTDLNYINHTDKINFTKNRLKLANKLRCSTKYNWNSKSTEGRVQLISSIKFLSENYLMEVLHNFGWENIIDKRDEKTVDKINSKIENYLDYRKFKPFSFPNDWDE
ncbi:nucleotidyl cyclase domain-containing protein [Elizabethkingia anophelis]|uniref:hypothetical protein n=1 Tax=Elizabethkingia anophelis TaxID=1117645 RepID=UPI00389294D1